MLLVSATGGSMKVFIQSQLAYYILYNDRSGLDDREVKLCDDYMVGHRISLYRDSEVYDDICDVTKSFSSRLTQLSLMKENKREDFYVQYTGNK
jgi:hypothetical protein